VLCSRTEISRFFILLISYIYIVFVFVSFPFFILLILLLKSIQLYTVRNTIETLSVLVVF